VSALYATDDENHIRLQWTRRVYPHFYGNEQYPAALVHVSRATHLSLYAGARTDTYTYLFQLMSWDHVHIRMDAQRSMSSHLTSDTGWRLLQVTK
jgi:hypothetical protein